MRLIITLFALWAVLASVQATAREDITYQLGSGDKLRVKVFNHEDLSGTHTINGSGRFSMPLIGPVTAKGMTVAELETFIIGKLKPDYLINPRVSVQMLNYRPFYIIGEVKTPDSYDYVDGMTYLNAVAIAGGYTYRAKKGYALVIHAGSETDDPVKVKMDAAVMPGDIIKIKERLF